jgi:uncharacterized protein YrzB (UPF0473 family)
MITGFNVINENGEEVKIDIIMQFRVEENDKEYVVFTVNDDGVSEDVYVNIAGIENIEGKYQLRLIPEEEKNMVLVFYDNLRDTIRGSSE